MEIEYIYLCVQAVDEKKGCNYLMNTWNIFGEISSDLQLVEKELQEAVKGPIPVLEEASFHLLAAGGKRLRPAFALISGKFSNYDPKKMIPLAVALELIHMASLVHDDVIDASSTRRGLPTVRAKWGNRMSMHAGDHIFARSLQLIHSIGNREISGILATTSVKMCEGEIQQILTAFDIRQTIKDYFYRIERKTALLIAASCRCGALAAGAERAIVRALGRFGHYIGMAFQITDDILDLTADQKKLGKPIGGDIRQGIMTLPMIFALRYYGENSRLAEILAAREKGEKEIKEAIQLISAAGAIEKTREISRRFVEKGLRELAILPVNPTRDLLEKLAHFINRRNY